MPAAKEQIRQIIADNNLNSVADVYSLLKDSFKDILQELMEAELDTALGYTMREVGSEQHPAISKTGFTLIKPSSLSPLSSFINWYSLMTTAQTSWSGKKMNYLCCC